MDDKGKNASFQVDQEILDARGINMTVLEVAGLSTCKYSERVQSMHLSEDDSAFLKGLRRRIKNRLASQNSRRRSMEHLRRLSRELRAVRACKGDALAERVALANRRRVLAEGALRLREHVVQILKERSDSTPVPDIEIPPSPPPITTRDKPQSPIRDKTTNKEENGVNHLLKEEESRDLETIEKTEIKIDDAPKKINARTVFLNSHFAPSDCNGVKREFGAREEFGGVEKSNGFVIGDICGAKEGYCGAKDFDGVAKSNGCMSDFVIGGICGVKGGYCGAGDGVKVEHCGASDGMKESLAEIGGVLNLSIKGREGRKSHGRKQTAPRRIAYAFCDYEDAVLDLKIKKETH